MKPLNKKKLKMIILIITQTSILFVLFNTIEFREIMKTHSEIYLKEKDNKSEVINPSK